MAATAAAPRAAVPLLEHMATTMVNDKRTLYVGARAGHARPREARERRAHARHLDMARCAGGLGRPMTSCARRSCPLER